MVSFTIRLSDSIVIFSVFFFHFPKFYFHLVINISYSPMTRKPRSFYIFTNFLILKHKKLQDLRKCPLYGALDRVLTVHLQTLIFTLWGF